MHKDNNRYKALQCQLICVLRTSVLAAKVYWSQQSKWHNDCIFNGWLKHMINADRLRYVHKGQGLLTAILAKGLQLVSATSTTGYTLQCTLLPLAPIEHAENSVFLLYIMPFLVMRLGAKKKRLLADMYTSSDSRHFQLTTASPLSNVKTAGYWRRRRGRMWSCEVHEIMCESILAWRIFGHLVGQMLVCEQLLVGLARCSCQVWRYFVCRYCHIWPMPSLPLMTAGDNTGGDQLLWRKFIQNSQQKMVFVFSHHTDLIWPALYT